MEICEIRNYMNYNSMTAANKGCRHIGVVCYWHDKAKEGGDIGFWNCTLYSYIAATYWLCASKQVTILTTRSQM